MSNGYQEWFVEFANMVNDLASIYEETNDIWLYNKLQEWIKIIEYYNSVIITKQSETILLA